MLPDELGIIHLFSNLDLDQDDDFFFEDDQRAPLVEEESTPTQTLALRMFLPLLLSFLHKGRFRFTAALKSTKSPV